MSATNSPVVTVTLSTADFNGLKAVLGLATMQSTTYLVAQTGSAADMNSNPFVTVTTGLQAAGCTGDSLAPSLAGFALNMNTGVLTLTFDETVDPNTLTVSQLTYQEPSRCCNTKSQPFCSLDGQQCYLYNLYSFLDNWGSEHFDEWLQHCAINQQYGYLTCCQRHIFLSLLLLLYDYTLMYFQCNIFCLYIQYLYPVYLSIQYYV